MKKRNKSTRTIYKFTDDITLSSDHHNYIVTNKRESTYFTKLDQAFNECHSILIKKKLMKKQCQSIDEMLDIINSIEKKVKTNIKRLEKTMTLK